MKNTTDKTLFAALPPVTLTLDPLTGLLSRNSFLEQVRIRLDQDAPKDWCIATIDLEHFKLFNDWYGQEAGDRLLQNIADYLKRIQDCYHYTVGYFGNDDFFLFLPNDSGLIRLVFQTVCDYVQSQEQMEGFLPIVGVYPITDSELSVGTMCNYAQIAASTLKGKFSQRICYFEAAMVKSLEKKQRVLHEINNGIPNGEFVFYLQPKCDSRTRKIISMEALVRWIHPKRGLVPPNEFIPILEKSGLITRLDMYIWNSVCQTLRRWQDEHKPIVPISINISIIDIENIDVPRYLSSLTEQYHLDPKYLMAEITETAFAENNATVKQTIDRLHKKGFTVLMDDFGSGYSSLNMLKDANIDILKLDMKFVDMNEENHNKGIQIMDSVINMAHRLNLLIVAEGVETSAQVSMLQSMNCLCVQGYYFYRPMPITDAEQLLSQTPTEDYHELRTSFAQQHNCEEYLVSYETLPSVSESITHILEENTLELARLNVITGEYVTIKKNPFLTDDAAGTVQSIRDYSHRLVDQGLIHPDDVEDYLLFMQPEHLQHLLLHKQTAVFYTVRRKVDGLYVRILIEFITGLVCSENNPYVVVVRRVADDSN